MYLIISSCNIAIFIYNIIFSESVNSSFSSQLYTVYLLKVYSSDSQLNKELQYLLSISISKLIILFSVSDNLSKNVVSVCNYQISLITSLKRLTQVWAMLLMTYSINKSQLLLWFQMITNTTYQKSCWITSMISLRLIHTWVRNATFYSTDWSKSSSLFWCSAIESVMCWKRCWIYRNTSSCLFFRWLYRNWYISKIRMRYIR